MITIDAQLTVESNMECESNANIKLVRSILIEFCGQSATTKISVNLLYSFSDFVFVDIFMGFSAISK